jgi:uncharacterized protein
VSRAIVLLARAPSAPGKTRLTRGLSSEAARALREALLLDTLDVARATGAPVVVSYTPEVARDEIAALAPGLSVVAQRGDDLGARMHRAMADLFDSGTQAVVLIGSDLPSLPPAHIEEAFARLGSGACCVFGPAEDGGYYLVGLSRGRANDAAMARRHRAVFTSIRWGTDAVLADSVAAAQTAGLTPALVSPWFDVDTRDDLARVIARGAPAVAARTRAWTARWLPVR